MSWNKQHLNQISDLIQQMEWNAKNHHAAAKTVTAALKTSRMAEISKVGEIVDKQRAMNVARSIK